MGMAETYGIVAPEVVKAKDKIHLAYEIPLPADHDKLLVVERMTDEIRRANYGFDAEVRPTAGAARERQATDAVYLYCLVPKSDEADPMRLHGLSYGLALRLRKSLDRD